MLQANGLTKTFQRGKRAIPAVQNVSLTLTPGHVTGIIGRSGSGKSTLLNLLAGLLTPTLGHVTLDDRDLYTQSDFELSKLRNQRIGYIPQGQTALPNLTVLQNILLPTGLFSVEAALTERAQELLELVGIPHLADAKPETLSGGELRRMAIARAMIQQPEVILADEPTSNLDKENTNAVISLLRNATDQGAAVLLVTHELDTLKSADAIFRMENGVLHAGSDILC